jgi:hypothetical protein
VSASTSDSVVIGAVDVAVARSALTRLRRRAGSTCSSFAKAAMVMSPIPAMDVVDIPACSASASATASSLEKIIGGSSDPLSSR